MLRQASRATETANQPSVAQTRLALDEAQLGGVLLCLGVGSTLTMPLAGWITHRHGSRVVGGLARSDCRDDLLVRVHRIYQAAGNCA